MKARRYMTMAGVAALLLTSCVTDDLYDTPHPDKGAVVIATDWTEALAESTVPETYLLRMDEGKTVQANEKELCYPDLLTPGAHTLLVYNEPKGIAVDGTTATVQMQDGMLIPLPEYLFSAEKELNVVVDDTLRITVPMKRRLCPIVLNLDLKGENVGRISLVEATLSGLSGSVDLRTGTPGSENLTARLDVQQTEAKSAYREGLLEMRCRVVGICEGQKQLLSVKITMDDGYTDTVISDLTELLKNLNSDMKPIELDGSIEAPQDGHFSGTIKDWEKVSGGDIDAN